MKKKMLCISVLKFIMIMLNIYCLIPHYCSEKKSPDQNFLVEMKC